MARSLPKPRPRLECGHFCPVKIKLLLEKFEGSKAWCPECFAYKQLPKEQEGLWPKMTS
jgi:hypothetical protein